MLVKFSVYNFLSFKENVVLDLTAEALKERNDYLHTAYLHNPKLSLLKSGVIYGYNGFGKSNLIKAYSTYRHLILNSFSFGGNKNELNIEPFRLNTSMHNESTKFESVFIIRNTKYRYCFEILNQKVVRESLHYSDGPVRENILFDREGQDFLTISKQWNKNTQNKVEHAKIFTKSHHLFLTVLLSQEAIPRVDEIANWFIGNVILNTEQNTLIKKAADIYTKEEYRSVILKFLSCADLGFTSVFEKISAHIDQGYYHQMVDDLYDVKKNNFELYTQHQLFDKDYTFQKVIEFELLKNESSGSIKYFILACFLAYSLNNGQLIWIDELDASLHTQLLVFLIDVFNSEKNNVRGSQLIFTTHNTIMLDNHLRRDQIWFVDKNKYGESTLHKGHTPETPIRINKSIEQEYRSGDIKRGGSKKLRNQNLPSLFDDSTSKEE